MSINYAHLRRQVIETEQGANPTNRYSWLDLAQEVLRMRSELAAIHIDSILGETND